MGLPPSMPEMEAAQPLGQDPSFGQPVQSPLLSQFRATMKTKRYELRDIYDHVVEFSGDQHGSRFIQTKLETANSEERERVFRELQSNLIPLMTDVFGNYVIQKFFEHGDQTQKKILANAMKGKVITLSYQPYGCRVVQKALDHVLVDQQASLVNELQNSVVELVKDQNGNHVIQKAIEQCPSPMIEFIVTSMRGQVHQLSIHSYGCRVVQRCLEKPDLPIKSLILAELIDCVQTMVPDQYGNYVVQHIVTHDDGPCKQAVLLHVSNHAELLSRHKYASNVVEKCIQNSDDAYRRNLVRALDSSNKQRPENEILVGLVKDQYGNYVIQKLLDTLCEADYLTFVDILHPAIVSAKRSSPNNKQVPAVEGKMDRFPYSRRADSSLGLASYQPNSKGYPLPLQGSHQYPASHFAPAVNHTPPSPPLTVQGYQTPVTNCITNDSAIGTPMGATGTLTAPVSRFS